MSKLINILWILVIVLIVYLFVMSELYYCMDVYCPNCDKIVEISIRNGVFFNSSQICPNCKCNVIMKRINKQIVCN